MHNIAAGASFNCLGCAIVGGHPELVRILLAHIPHMVICCTKPKSTELHGFSTFLIDAEICPLSNLLEFRISDDELQEIEW